MQTLQQKVEDFLAQERIAVAGVSRQAGSGAANLVYCKLRDSGYRVFPINPSAEEVEGDPCYPNLAAVPEPVDGVVISTQPQVTEQIVRECAELGISRVWMHRSFGTGSVSEEAAKFCEDNDITVIPGACPMMYCQPDFGHKCMRWFLGLTGGLPK